jgi:cellulose binding protein with CBM10 domain
VKSIWKPTVIIMSAATALLSGCVSYDDGFEGDEYADETADDADAVLGHAFQHMSYPYCASAASDPDKDGWGWENNMSCIVRPTTTGYPICASAASDPDKDGWGWENNKSCIVQGSTGSTGGTSGSCANLEGTASTMAALVVSVALELKRWQPSKDFQIVKVNNEDTIQLTSTGKARCADGKCANTQALLDFQKNEANGKIRFPNNVTLNAPALRSRLVAKLRDQISCESQPSNGGTTNCPVEEHTLTFQKSEKGGCDTNYFFVAKATNGTALKYPGQLKNKLLWADKTNPYVAFKNVGETVSVDPTYGLNEEGSASSGSCTAACTKISSSNIAGGCCSCNGTTKSFVKSTWNATTFLCQ